MTDLSGVEVAEAADDLRLVEDSSCGLQAADGLHVAVVGQGLVARHRGAGRRALVQLVQLVRLNNDICY